MRAAHALWLCAGTACSALTGGTGGYTIPGPPKLAADGSIPCSHVAMPFVDALVAVPALILAGFAIRDTGSPCADVACDLRSASLYGGFGLGLPYLGSAIYGLYEEHRCVNAYHP